jgi:hypothetical protein
MSFAFLQLDTYQATKYIQRAAGRISPAFITGPLVNYIFTSHTIATRLTFSAYSVPGRLPKSSRSTTTTRIMASSLGDTLHRYRILLFIAFLFFLTHLVLKSQPQLQPSLEIPHAVHKWTAHVKALLTSSAPKPVEHPIPRLMLAAHRKHKGMIGSQSKTLREAVKEYERRYGRQPPRGFDEWFEFVKENGVKIVDEYDGMVGDLEPFWGLEGQEMRRRAEQVRFAVLFFTISFGELSAYSYGIGWRAFVYRFGAYQGWETNTRKR